MSRGRKIPIELENPVDNVCLSIVEVIHPFFYKAGFSANGLTCLSGIFQFISVACIAHGMYFTAVPLYLIGYMFDVMDGWYARYYKMTSPFGDWLDHSKDVIVHIMIFITMLLVIKAPMAWRVAFAISSFVILIMTIFFISCQEAYYEKSHESKSFQMMPTLCTTKEAKSKLYILRFGGPGSMVVNIVLFCIILGIYYRMYV
jgi:phosphatidylglycerophosphate synthase